MHHILCVERINSIQREKFYVVAWVLLILLSMHHAILPAIRVCARTRAHGGLIGKTRCPAHIPNTRTHKTLLLEFTTKTLLHYPGLWAIIGNPKP